MADVYTGTPLLTREEYEMFIAGGLESAAASGGTGLRPFGSFAVLVARQHMFVSVQPRALEAEGEAVRAAEVARHSGVRGVDMAAVDNFTEGVFGDANGVENGDR